MRGKNTWHYHPYTRLNQLETRTLPYICRLAPGETDCELEWMDSGNAGAHRLAYWERNHPEKVITIPADSFDMKVMGLKQGQEYELRIERTDSLDCHSVTRIIRTGSVPGKVINYLHPQDETYAFSGHCLCSPSIVRLPSGKLMVSMDVYASRHAQNLTLLYTSEDDGETWHYCNDLFPCYWGKLFVHRNELYMLAISSEYGFLVIGKSSDEGMSWTPPTFIFPGSGIRDEMGMHQAPTPVITHNGRIWSAVDYGTWEMGGHCSGLVSVSEDADLLDPESWSCTEFLPFSHEWEGAVEESKWGCLEGNAVAGPDGEIYNMLRYQITYVFKDEAPRGAITHGKALLLKADRKEPEKQLVFDRFIDFNGGMSKFQVRQDIKTGNYVALLNRVENDATPAQRNILSMAVSQDLIHWRIVTDLINYSKESPDETGFQYPDFIFSGEDILYLSRTAYNGAANFHDSNYTTFHRLQNFRSYIIPFRN